MSKKAIVIGSGFAGLSSACFMAKAGWQVTVLEKHASPGGRARQLKEAGFTFDMGPSWYWMPDVFERFFEQFGRKVSDYYTIRRLDPSYRVYFEDEVIDVPADYDELSALFESTEAGSAKQLDKFLEEAAYKYNAGMHHLVHKPGLSFTELLDWQVMSKALKLDVFRSMRSHVSRHFNHPKLRQILEFPVLFLGAMPNKIPALYSLMSYADIIGGTWYPEGGMYSIVRAMHQLAVELGVRFQFGENVIDIKVEGNKARTVISNKAGADGLNGIQYHQADVVIGAADYHHIENKLLEPEYRNYTEAYWEKRTMAPGCLLYYVGLNKRLPGVRHHSLFFDADFEAHGSAIYTTKNWCDDPLFYMCVPSVTDATVAPQGHENLFLLIPAAAGLQNDSTEIREQYFNTIITRIERHLQTSITDAIVYKKSFAHSDFISEYNSYKGNAYGLANTLSQTAFLKPRCRNKVVQNLFYTGQLTVPGPGVPPSLISGEVVAKEVLRTF